MPRWTVVVPLALAAAAIGGCGLLLKAAANDLDFDVFAGSTEIGTPTWSRDGHELLFHLTSDGTTAIYRVSSEGGDVDRVDIGPMAARSPAWSRDGQRIAFSGSDDSVAYAYGIYVAEADGSDPRRIHNGRGDTDHPTWSPDGRRLAFVDGSIDEVLGSVGRLVIVAVDGQASRRLAVRAVRTPAWSPDGKWIAFSRSENATYGVYVVRADGPPRERRVIRGASDPAWSPDGRSLAVSEGLEGIYVVPFPRGRARRLPIALPQEPGPDDLSWSPDGRWIAFATTDAIYIARIDGSERRRLADISDG